MFKINNKDTRTTPRTTYFTFFLVFLLLLWTGKSLLRFLRPHSPDHFTVDLFLVSLLPYWNFILKIFIWIFVSFYQLNMKLVSEAVAPFSHERVKRPLYHCSEKLQLPKFEVTGVGLENDLVVLRTTLGHLGKLAKHSLSKWSTIIIRFQVLLLYLVFMWLWKIRGGLCKSKSNLLFALLRRNHWRVCIKKGVLKNFANFFSFFFFI